MIEGVGLADAIRALRSDLQAAITAGRDEPLRFLLSPIELTLQHVVTKSAEGKLGWRVLEIGGTAESARTQTVKLTLEPGWLATDGSFRTGRDWTIASDDIDDSRIGHQ
jgi:hypothetical protein